ncbi:hypothetical protein [Micromonospora sp. NBC_01796]|uniref:hypothetical protein n=1 Tax=Micromonospora sp. NBC_01796 TaxID=2975987 RepID=UPI002DD9B67D|nr:hypothetical protein [Micromonospora sp. NBC_01796]WSA83522.1 hypothetical protein OIE47_24385 [Micromonospora sp. NBC_01796]
MGLTASWKPGNNPILPGTDRATPSGDLPDPDAPAGKGQSPVVFLRPERILADTEPLAVADHGRWRYLRAA